MRARLRTRLLRAVSTLAAATLFVSAALSSSGAAFAADFATATTAPLDSSPYVAAELLERRTETARHYRLSDGTVRAEIYGAPIHYKDASGKWERIDPTILASGIDQFENTRSQAKTTFHSGLEANGSVGIDGDGWSIGIAAPGMRRALKMAKDDTVTYIGAADDTFYQYRILGDGLKETVVLQTPSAAATVTVDVALTGLELRNDFDGTWAFFKPGASAPEGHLGGFSVFDSSKDAAGDPATSTDAEMHVEATSTGARMSYTVPRAWLDDPKRVYPVMIDPTYNWGTYGTDSYIYSNPGYRNVCYNYVTYLQCGWFVWNGVGGMCRPYMQFNVSSLANKFVRTANLRTYSNWGSTVYTQLWESLDKSGVGTTYNTRPLSYEYITAQIPAAQGYVNWPVTPTVRSWVGSYGVGAHPNYGFRLTMDEAQRNLQRYSSVRAAEPNRPRLEVEYVDPATAIHAAGVNTTGVVPADGAHEVTATVRVLSMSETDIRQVNMLGNYADPANRRGLIEWFATDPGPSRPVRRDLGGGKGWFAYNPADSYNTALITPVLDRCDVAPASENGLVGYDVTFVYRPNANFGYPVGNTVGFQVGYGTGGGGSEIVTPWYTLGPVFNVVPGAAEASAAARGLDWFFEHDGNSDGIPDGGADVGLHGRGAVDLTWSPAAGTVSGYRVYLHDGNTWRNVGSSSTTSWTSDGKRLYPSDSGVSALAPGTASNPFLAGTGMDLRDDPTPLYAKTAGTSLDAYPGYLLKVVPYNLGGETPLSECATMSVQLPKRTIYANATPRHAEVDLGDAAGHALAAYAETGTLVASVTDLAVNSYGPDASLTRTYRSDATQTTTFAPGWRFGFEAAVDVSYATTASVTYIDETGERLRFTSAGTNAWRAPRGVVATLTKDPILATWKLERSDGEVSRFGIDGRLLSVMDRIGNPVTYDWSAPGVHITAANGHEVVVTLDGSGKVTKATYTRGTITRQVDYDAAGTRVTSRVGMPDPLVVEYGYTGSLLTTLSVPGFTPGGVAATWAFSYGGSGKLTRATLPGGAAGVSQRWVGLAYASGGCDVSRPARVGSASTDTTVTESFTFDGNGWQLAHGLPGEGSSHPGTATAVPGVTGSPLIETSAAGVTTRRTFDTNGNELSSTDAEGHTTTTTYGTFDLPTTVTDPKGAVTTNRYDDHGSLTATVRTLSATETAETLFEVDSVGRTTVETRSIAPGVYAVTASDYTGHPDWDEPTTTTNKGVMLSSTRTVDLVTRKGFGPFGDVSSEIDARGIETVARQLDEWGCVVSETDATGTVTHHAYDVLGHETETSRTAGTAWTDLTRRVVDPTGLVLTEEAYLADSSGAPALALTTTHIFDGSGRELATVASDTGVTKTTFDAKGDLSQTWLPAATAPPADAPPASTSVTNADGQEVSSRVATDAATTTTYDSEGEVASVDPPDANATSFAYDPAGNMTTETVPAPGGGTLLATRIFDLGGRLVTSRDTSGNVTTLAYDLLDRQTGASIAGDRVSATTYNALGWVLSSSDPDGVITTLVYDECGRAVSRTMAVGGSSAETTHRFDDLGRETATTNPDGTVIEWAHDAFGRVKRRTERTAAGALVHDVSSNFDELGRPERSVDEAAETTTTFTYATTPTDESVVTREVRGAKTTIMSSAQGLEGTRTIAALSSSPTMTLSVVITARDTAGRPSSWRYGAPAGTLERSYVRDAAGRAWQSGVGMDHTSYVFDPASGRKLSEEVLTDQFGEGYACSRAYSYTAGGRLAQARACACGSWPAVGWAYPDGRPAHAQLASSEVPYLVCDYEYDTAGQIARAGATTFVYSDGHLASSLSGTNEVAYSFDARGRRRSFESQTASATMTWTDSSRLSRYVLDVGKDGSADVAAAFAYDAAGQRTRSVVSRGSSTTTTTYTYDGLQLERLESVTDGVATTLCYLYDEDGKPLALVGSVPDTATPIVLAIATNDRGDVTALVDMSGNRVASWSYDPYGLPVDPTVYPGSLGYGVARIADAQALRYAGYVYDEFSGLYYCSARYYDPATCQFISRDPAEADGEESAYQYCGGDPVGKVDPSGLYTKFSSIAVKADYKIHLAIEYTWPVGGAWTATRVRAQFLTRSRRYYVSQVKYGIGEWAQAWGYKDGRGTWYSPYSYRIGSYDSPSRRDQRRFVSVPQASVNSWSRWTGWDVSPTHRILPAFGFSSAGKVYVFYKVNLFDTRKKKTVAATGGTWILDSGYPGGAHPSPN
ncbi:MAG: RHS repeat-associated core domain-containing protein [Coriobacteriia bacterium]|nr:RHS repeat-associated core domain-containing protein [Coriobacteriia bacterium]